MSARGDTIDPLTVGTYHIHNRCVRRAWLCGGVDPVTGKNYTHRRKWYEQRLALQATLFAIEVCFQAGMVNHAHNVSRNRPDVVATWSDQEVVYRNLLINQLPRSFDGDLHIPSPAEIKIEIALASEEKMLEFRTRLSDPSWFMKQLDEYLARRINQEDGVTGRLWEAPFKCRRLEDDAAVLSCGIYVDLNQLRAGEVGTPEESEYTSGYARIEGAKYLADLKYNLNQPEPFDINQLDQTTAAAEQQATGAEANTKAPSETREQRLARCYRERPDGALVELTLQEGPDINVADGLKPSKFPRLTDKGLLPIQLTDYLELLDWTGRKQVSGKRGAIPENLAPILERLHINTDNWLDTIKDFEELFGRSVGRVSKLVERAKASGQRWIRGARNCAAAFT